jgi:hypothetical protein
VPSRDGFCTPLPLPRSWTERLLQFQVFCEQGLFSGTTSTVRLRVPHSVRRCFPEPNSGVLFRQAFEMGSVGSVAVESSSNPVLHCFDRHRTDAGRGPARSPNSNFVFCLVLSLFQVMRKDQRRPSAKTPAVMKPSPSPTTPGVKNRNQSRTDRKMALQQDVRSR